MLAACPEREHGSYALASPKSTLNSVSIHTGKVFSGCSYSANRLQLPQVLISVLDLSRLQWTQMFVLKDKVAATREWEGQKD
jgi:hypothetical protein